MSLTSRGGNDDSSSESTTPLNEIVMLKDLPSSGTAQPHPIVEDVNKIRAEVEIVGRPRRRSQGKMA